MKAQSSKGGAAATNQSSDKLLHLIEVMSTLDEPVRLQNLAAMADMNPSTTLRYLSALQSRQYAAQHIDTGRYQLTFKFCRLAENISSRLSVRNIAMPFLRNTAHVFSESCNLSIQSDMMVLYVEVVDGPQKTLMSTQRIGNMAPLHCTGVGKLFLTEYTPQQIEQLTAIKGFTKYTPNTITELADLNEHLEQIRRVGYSFDNEECEIGARCIAVPIRNYSGKIVAGMSVSGPTTRMTDEHIFANLTFLLDSAEQISIRLGYQKPE